VGSAQLGSAGDARSVERTNPDIVLIRLTMPGADGSPVCSRIAAAFPDAKVVGSSVSTDENVTQDPCSKARRERIIVQETSTRSTCPPRSGRRCGRVTARIGLTDPRRERRARTPGPPSARPHNPFRHRTGSQRGDGPRSCGWRKGPSVPPHETSIARWRSNRHRGREASAEKGS